MTPDEVLCALDALAVQTGSLACLGCGHEHNCGIHGCAIIREAGKIIRWLSTDNTALRYAIKPAKVKRSQEQNFNGAVAYLRALIEEQRAQIEKAEAENAVLREKVPQWISVEDRLPDTIICGAGTKYSEAVIVWTNGKKAMIAVWDGTNWICPVDFWEAWDEEITHWMTLPGIPIEGGRHE